MLSSGSSSGTCCSAIVLIKSATTSALSSIGWVLFVVAGSWFGYRHGMGSVELSFIPAQAIVNLEEVLEVEKSFPVGAQGGRAEVR
jgi:hypothetical protein